MADKKSGTKPTAQAAATRTAAVKKAPAKAPPAKPVKAAAKAAPAPKPATPVKAVPAAKAVAPAKPAPAAKAPAVAKAAAKTVKKPEPPKPAAAKAPPPKAEAKPKPSSPAKKPEKQSAKAAPEAKATKPSPKVAPKAKAPPKTEAPKPPHPVKAAKPDAKPAKVAEVKADKPQKPAKPAKPPKEPKPPKLAPVEAAFAKPKPAKPLAVAAGRAMPITRTLATPIVRVAPKPLSAPKPVAAEPELVGDLQNVPAFKAKSGAKGMVLVGAIAGAFGVKGEVRLRAFTDKKEGVISYGPLYGEDGKVLLKPKSWRELKDGVAVVAPEVKSREDAEKLKGTRLFVPRANLPSPAEDEFYIVDLLGCRAEALDGKILGEICAVWNFGAGDIIEYRPPNGGPNVRVTFTRETTPLVDLPGKRVVLDPPAPEVIEK